MIEIINTPLGELHGRDAIYLDDEKYDRSSRKLNLIGEVNGNLCSQKVVGEFIPYNVKFVGVCGWVKVELDEWLSLDKPKFHETSSFYRFEENGINTYVFQTYDWVFEIQCESYEIKFGKNT